MKKAIKFTTYLALLIILLFGIGILFTYINDWLQQSGFFADSLVVPYKDQYGLLINSDGEVDKSHHWGHRHYWYNTMCIFLFILSIGRIALWIIWYWREELNKK